MTQQDRETAEPLVRPSPSRRPSPESHDAPDARGWRAGGWDQDAWRLWPPGPAMVEAARAGDQDVLRLVITAAIPKLVSFYRGQGIRLHDAEDLAGDTCEAVVRNLARLRDPTRFEPWFWKVARSKLRDHFRRKGRRPARPDSLDGMVDDPSDLLLIADEHAQVRLAFAGLGSRDRELLWMRDVIGLGYGDISGRLSLSEGAIRIAVMRARQRLEAALEQYEA